MSTSTPTPAAPPPSAPPTTSDTDKSIIDYLERTGHARAAATMRAEIAARAAGTPLPPLAGGGRQVGLEEFADKNGMAKTISGGAAAGGAAGGAGGAQPGTPQAQAQAQQQAALQQQQKRGLMLSDAASWEKGYEGLRAFVDNSLDIHRPELSPILLPLFVHSYIDLVLCHFRDAADNFLKRFANDHTALHAPLVRLLSSLRSQQHIDDNLEMKKWRNDRYVIRLSERGWGLLSGWLQGGAISASEGTEVRGRDRLYQIVNERLKIETIAGPPQASFSQSHGLSLELPSSSSQATTNITNGQKSLIKKPLTSPSSSLDPLKLGLPPLDARLQKEVDRLVPPSSTSSTSIEKEKEKEKERVEVEGEETIEIPTSQELPPYPNGLRTVDVMREVEKVREGRKRIRLGVGSEGEVGKELIMGGSNSSSGIGREKVLGGAKPSVCLFTVHDAGESLITTAFSEDSSIMACGFSESYIRLWSLTGSGLKPTIGEGSSGPSKPSLKLIGHSAPVYALSFDPISGAAGPPKYLLSSSGDGSVRLWSLETFTCLVVWRAGREPIWDVEWGPKGIYFASGGRDRTARVWTTEKTNAVRILAGHSGDVNCVKFHPNSLYLATASSDRTCRLWDVQKGSCVRVFVGHKASVGTIAISDDGRWLASASEDLSIIIWSLSTSLPLKTLTGHTSSIYSLSFSAESTVLVSGSADGTVRCWDVLSEQTKEVVSGVGNAAKVGGLPVIAGGLGGLGKRREEEEEERRGVKESQDLLVTLATKRTPVVEVKFTQRNLVLAAGAN